MYVSTYLSMYVFMYVFLCLLIRVYDTVIPKPCTLFHKTYTLNRKQ